MVIVLSIRENNARVLMQDYCWVSVIWSSLIRVLVNDDHCNLNVGSWNSDPSYARSFRYRVMLSSRRPGFTVLHAA